MSTSGKNQVNFSPQSIEEVKSFVSSIHLISFFPPSANYTTTSLRWPRLFGQHAPVLEWRLAVFCLCGGAPCRQVVKVHSIRRVTVKRPMRPGLVVERQVALYTLVGCADGFIGM